ncbi:MAG: hypothetical protein ACI4W6_05600 [Acutalibacteraceae bacterium]
MLPKKAVKIICIVLAVLMALSAVAVLTAVFAVDAESIVHIAPTTGDNDLDYIVPIALIAVAVLAAVICLVLPKIKKKDAHPKKSRDEE